ncbi:uncharacterized protein LOC119071340 [Bradysia coprophila]|uniref:uncharacterized protein LOC119071340 n=1 Tax=Bradysia coprophila TaxID=38358 RepID=UPI00187D8418|nr:uncharacterized protein LOC119071340 [Bradysia coprophila]
MKLIFCIALSLIGGFVLINAEPIKSISGTVGGAVYVNGEKINPDNYSDGGSTASGGQFAKGDSSDVQTAVSGATISCGGAKLFAVLTVVSLSSFGYLGKCFL